MPVEWGIAHVARYTEPPNKLSFHRGPMSREDAEQWIFEFVEDGGRPGAFVIVKRVISEWTSEDTQPCAICTNAKDSRI